MATPTTALKMTTAVVKVARGCMGGAAQRSCHNNQRTADYSIADRSGSVRYSGARHPRKRRRSPAGLGRVVQDQDTCSRSADIYLAARLQCRYRVSHYY